MLRRAEILGTKWGSSEKGIFGVVLFGLGNLSFILALDDGLWYGAWDSHP